MYFILLKEKRTYDQVYGDLPQGNGDANFVNFGRESYFPTTNALAEKYVAKITLIAMEVLSADGLYVGYGRFVYDS